MSFVENAARVSGLGSKLWRYQSNRVTVYARSYYQSSQEKSQAMPDDVKVVDMRSDTLTKPTPRMRKAMAEAEVGDDVFGEDPTVNALQDRVAEMTGKDRALFVPTGTMGNLISVMVHCRERGVEAILGHRSHIHLFEQGGIAQIAGVSSMTIPNLPDGTLDMTDFDACVRPTTDVHQPLSRLVCVENTQNFCGGKILPLSFLKQIREKSDEFELKVHMDGARLLNAVVASGKPAAEIVSYVDTANICLSKGIGAPVGSIIIGPDEFIDRCRRVRKALGGGMRQAGVLAAAAMAGLDEAPVTLARDHVHAKMLATAINDNGKGVVSVDLEGVHTNLVFVRIHKEGISADDMCARLAQVKEEELSKFGAKVKVLVRPARLSNTAIRMCTNNGACTQLVEAAIEKWKYVTDEELSSSYRPVSLVIGPWTAKVVRVGLHRDLETQDVEDAIQKMLYVISEYAAAK